ncbi:MAG: hypothetical protein D6712_20000 [Chloroflexi bacterium]|nr:MAG: hypothetical protein D6712_20000 [Chloroflexota bacterium]
MKRARLLVTCFVVVFSLTATAPAYSTMPVRIIRDPQNLRQRILNLIETIEKWREQFVMHAKKMELVKTLAKIERISRALNTETYLKAITETRTQMANRRIAAHFTPIDNACDILALSDSMSDIPTAADFDIPDTDGFSVKKWRARRRSLGTVSVDDFEWDVPTLRYTLVFDKTFKSKLATSAHNERPAQVDLDAIRQILIAQLSEYLVKASKAREARLAEMSDKFMSFQTKIAAKTGQSQVLRYRTLQKAAAIYQAYHEWQLARATNILLALKALSLLEQQHGV